MKKIFFILIFVVLASGTYLLSRSDKISVEETFNSSKGVMYWSQNVEPLSAADLQDDAVVNVIYTNNNSYGVIKRLNNEQNPLIEIQFYSSKNNPLAKLKEQWQYDVAFPDYLVSTNGGKVLATDVSNRIRLFDSQGQLEDSYKIIEQYEYNTETIIVNAASKNLDILFTGITVPGQSGTTLVLRNTDNNILWQKKYPDWYVRTVAMSDGNKLMAAALYKSGDGFSFMNLIINQNGDLLYESEQRTSDILFSSKSEYAAFLDKDKVELVDLTALKKTGTFVLNKPDHVIIDAAFSDEGILMIQSAQVSRNNKDQFNPWQYINNTLTSLNMKAELISSVEFEEDWVIHPSLWYDTVKKEFFYGHNAGYRYIRADQ